jgi:hypothetical protein
MSSGSRLDQVVKGTAPPGVSVQSIASRLPSPQPFTEGAAISPDADEKVPLRPSDPLADHPSSPPQIYLNLLILEASLRSQYLALRARRRQNTFFLTLLGLWLIFFSYALFLKPREDGSGIGGSVYWVVELGEKVALMGGVVLAILIWGTGQWERGIRWPRRFVGVANRGLRTMNCKIVVIKGPWWREMFGHLAFLLPHTYFFPPQSSAYHYIDASTERKVHHITKHGNEDDSEFIREEDLAPGGDHIKLLLLPKSFSPDFRENWELYRTEYWEKENERRAALLQRLRAQQRRRAKEQGGWLWWTGWRGWKGRRPQDLEKHHHKGHTQSHSHRHLGEKDAKRHISRGSESHSRSNSRSSTPGALDLEDRPPSRGSRRGSTSSNPEGRRRSRMGTTLGVSQMSKLTPADGRGSNGTSRQPHQGPRGKTPSFGWSSGNESDLPQDGSRIGKVEG